MTCRLRTLVAALTALVVAASADAGYLGSPLQNAEPLGEHAGIQMAAEEVVILLSAPEVDGRELTEEERWELEWEEQLRLHPGVEVAAAFEFVNDGPADEVLMYVPLQVRHPFYGPYLWIEDEAAALDVIEIFVDGEPVEPFAVYRGVWREDEHNDWDELLEIIDPLNDEKPADGELFCFLNGATSSEDENPNPPYAAESLLAAWRVEFPAGESRLVEYRQRYDFSTDYEYHSFRFCYPLYTGAGWAGDIGRGRITVLGEPDFDWSYLAEYLGIYLPPPTWEADYPLRFEGPFAGSTLLEGFAGEYERILVWSFADLEPVGGVESWKTFNPDFGDIYNADYHEWSAALERGDKPAPDGRQATMVYLALGEPADGFMVIDPSPKGLTAYDEPDGEPLERGPLYTNILRVDERRGDWLHGSWYDFGTSTEHEGWVPLTATGDEGLVRPRLMPQY